MANRTKSSNSELAATEELPTQNQCSGGFHAVESLLARNPENIEAVWVDSGRRDQRIAKLKKACLDRNVALHSCARTQLDQLAGGKRHQGVVATIKQVRDRKLPDLNKTLDSLDHPPLLLVLDQIKDPHNLGACLRSAEGAGVDAVILPRDHACPVNDTVRRVAAGAAERVTIIYVTNLSRVLLELKSRGIWLVGCADQAKNTIYKNDLTGNVAVLLGAEDKGLRQLTQKYCDHLVSIPMAGEVPSLNVSVACGIALFEAVRQRST